jgi:nicotinate-nucleotide pyrophosphorylase (carboxylating)
MVMLKDNHIWATGSITNAVRRAKEAAGFAMKIEVECQNEDEAIEASESGADIVMLDNFSPSGLAPIVQRLKERFPHVLIEASGVSFLLLSPFPVSLSCLPSHSRLYQGINDSNMSEYMIPGIDIISRGSLTHGYPCLDISMKIRHE